MSKKTDDGKVKKPANDNAPVPAAQEPYPTGKPWHPPAPGVPMNEAPKEE